MAEPRRILGQSRISNFANDMVVTRKKIDTLQAGNLLQSSLPIHSNTLVLVRTPSPYRYKNRDRYVCSQADSLFHSLPHSFDYSCSCSCPHCIFILTFLALLFSCYPSFLDYQPFCKMVSTRSSTSTSRILSETQRLKRDNARLRGELRAAEALNRNLKREHREEVEQLKNKEKETRRISYEAVNIERQIYRNQVRHLSDEQRELISTNIKEVKRLIECVEKMKDLNVLFFDSVKNMETSSNRVVFEEFGSKLQSLGDLFVEIKAVVTSFKKLPENADPPTCHKCEAGIEKEEVDIRKFQPILELYQIIHFQLPRTQCPLLKKSRPAKSAWNISAPNQARFLGSFAADIACASHALRESRRNAYWSAHLTERKHL